MLKCGVSADMCIGFNVVRCLVGAWLVVAAFACATVFDVCGNAWPLMFSPCKKKVFTAP